MAEPVLVRSVDHALAVGDATRAAKARTYLGMCLSDRCEYEQATTTLTTAIDGFCAARQQSWRGYAEAMLARAVERSGDPASATELARAGLDHVRRGGWRAVLPWPMVVLGSCALGTGDRDSAATSFAESLTYATEINDPCYQAMALRGLGLLQLPGDQAEAARLLREGVAATRRHRDVYPWIRALILTDLVELQRGADRRVVDEATALAAAGPLPDLAERLLPYRAGPDTAAPDLDPRQTLSQTVPS